MSAQVREIVENFANLVRLERGADSSSISGLSDPTQATPTQMIFVSSRAHLATALESQSQVWLVQKTLVSDVPPTVKVVLSSDNVQLCMALISQKFFPLTRHHLILEGPRISPSAVISPSARLGTNCIVGPGAVVGDNCIIGDGTVIGANSVIEPAVKIGRHCHIHPLVFIGHSCEIGNDCEVHPNTTIGSEGFGYAQDKEINHHRLTHYGRVILEDHVHIGSGVQIDRGTFLDSRIGSGAMIDNHCHFGHNIQIGRNTVITGGLITAGSVKIGSYCVIGGRTTIAGHLEITDKVQIGGLSAVTKSITKPGLYAGFPIENLKKNMRTRASLKKVPAVIAQLRQVLKHLGLNDDTLKDDESQ